MLMPSEMVVIWGSFVDMTIYVLEIKLVFFFSALIFLNVFVFYSGSVGYIASYEHIDRHGVQSFLDVQC